MGGLALKLSPQGLSPAEFADICAANPHLMIELTATGELVAMPPTGSVRGDAMKAWARNGGAGTRPRG
jgi:Uma2 family endonuclease